MLVATVLEDIVGQDEIPVLFVVSDNETQQLKRLRLEGTELQGLFSWTASRRMRGRRASEVDMSIHLGCQNWSVFDAVNQPLKSGGAAVARWGCTRKVEILFRFAAAVCGLRCPEKLQ